MNAEVVALEGRAHERRLREVADELEATGWAFEIADAQWRLFHVSSELCQLLYESDPEAIGVGRHLLESRYGPAYKMVTQEHRTRWLERNGPYMLHDNPKLVEHLGDVLPPAHAEAIGQSSRSPRRRAGFPRSSSTAASSRAVCTTWASAWSTTTATPSGSS